MSNGGKEQKKKKFYKIIKFKTELFKCCCFYLSVLVWKWDIPREKRNVPPGSLNRQKPQPRIQNPSTPWILATLFPSWLIPRQKDILLMVRGSVASMISCQCCIYGFTIKQPLGRWQCVALFLGFGVGPCHPLQSICWWVEVDRRQGTWGWPLESIPRGILYDQCCQPFIWVACSPLAPDPAQPLFDKWEKDTADRRCGPCGPCLWSITPWENEWIASESYWPSAWGTYPGLLCPVVIHVPLVTLYPLALTSQVIMCDVMYCVYCPFSGEKRLWLCQIADGICEHHPPWWTARDQPGWTCPTAGLTQSFTLQTNAHQCFT